MKVSKNDALAKQLLDEMVAEKIEDRSGQHPSVTDLLRCLTASWWDAHRTVEHGKKKEIYFLLGIGLEKSLLAARKQNPTAGKSEGIFYHVDDFDYGLIEVKSYRGSVKKVELPDGTFQLPDYYIRQVMSYCVMLGVSECDLGIIYIIPAEFEVYHIQFDEMELSFHRKWMHARRDVWEAAEIAEKAPESYRHNQDWECKDCQYKLLCETRGSGGGAW